MHHLARIHVPVARRVRRSPAPRRPQHRNRSARNLPVLGLPFLHSHHSQPIIRVLLHFVANINHHRRPEEMLFRNLIERDFPRRKMRRRVHVRPVMLQHPEAPRKITILLHRRVRLGLKHMIVPRPSRKFVAHRIRHIYDEIPPVAHPLNPIPFSNRLMPLRHSRRDPKSHRHRKHNHKHPTQFHNPHRISPSKNTLNTCNSRGGSQSRPRNLQATSAPTHEPTRPAAILADFHFSFFDFQFLRFRYSKDFCRQAKAEESRATPPRPPSAKSQRTLHPSTDKSSAAYFS